MRDARPAALLFVAATLSVCACRNAGVLVSGVLILTGYANAQSEDLRPKPSRDHPPHLIGSSCSLARYPIDAVRANKEGETVVEVSVAEDGHPTMTVIRSSAGFDSLDTAAEKLFMSCRYEPAIQDGVPVASSVQLSYVWRIRR